MAAYQKEMGSRMFYVEFRCRNPEDRPHGLTDRFVIEMLYTGDPANMTAPPHGGMAFLAQPGDFAYVSRQPYTITESLHHCPYCASEDVELVLTRMPDEREGIAGYLAANQ
jgi:hypothetical protein